MEKNINIAKILSDKPRGTKLYSPLCGNCRLGRIVDDFATIWLEGQDSNIDLTNEGKYVDTGELVLFPSKKMKNWHKFSWKHGDVLVSDDFHKEVIFDSFTNDDYTSFKGKHLLDCTDDNNHLYSEEFTCFTESYNLEEEDAAKTFINTIEERCGGKLNIETLEIEKIKPKYAFKPLDYVLTRDAEHKVWTLCQVSHIDKENNIVFVGGWIPKDAEVIPFTGNEYLLGTKKDFKEE